MQEKTERWLELCKQAAIEQDPEKLMALVKEINDLLETKERRLGIIPPKDSKLPHCRLVCEGDNSETFPLPPGCCSLAVPETPQYLYPQTQFAESLGGNLLR